MSQAQRQAANEWYDHTLYSRLNDKLSGTIVLIMHRLHEDDLAGHVMAQEDWEVVRLPAIAEEDELHPREAAACNAAIVMSLPTPRSTRDRHKIRCARPRHGRARSAPG